MGERCLQAWPLGCYAGDFIGVDVLCGNASLDECVPLEVKVLFIGWDPGIADEHRRVGFPALRKSRVDRFSSALCACHEGPRSLCTWRERGSIPGESPPPVGLFPAHHAGRPQLWLAAIFPSVPYLPYSTKSLINSLNCQEWDFDLWDGFMRLFPKCMRNDEKCCGYELTYELAWNQGETKLSSIFSLKKGAFSETSM